jgi:hypothetical protein
VKSLVYLITGRLRFPRQRVGQTIELDGEPWRIFREAGVSPRGGDPAAPEAIFRPRFHVARMSVRQNIFFSLLPMWLIFGMTGFRSKLWLVNPQTGDFSGLYTWNTLEDAENYQRSPAGRFMTNRSVPGSVSFQVIAHNSPLGSVYSAALGTIQAPTGESRRL